jgi:hypothetical protein
MRPVSECGQNLAPAEAVCLANGLDALASTEVTEDRCNIDASAGDAGLAESYGRID